MTQKLVREESTGSVDTEGTGDTSSDHHSRRRLSRSTRLIIMLTMTFAFFAVELAFGYLSHSMALVADSFHMLSDVMALGIAFACLRVIAQLCRFFFLFLLCRRYQKISNPLWQFWF